ncbi:terpene synthase 21 [Prunus dulcis]|uniref:Terpene synthase 21 n=1 Tax=Prunus dulcis TaxID=3755 RepID=A0A4Y1RCJ0_PRUDU|nr:terpene synthase 21 [Prunus dulcis]
MVTGIGSDYEVELKAAQPQNAKPDEIARRTANFHPSIWGDQFINYDDSQDMITHAHKQGQVDELKEVVRREVFTTSAGDLSHQLKLIDAIQRLGVAYHFETEIEEALERMHTTFHDHDSDDDGDLYNVALCFRLLRQHGHNVSCDIFNKFKDENGIFKESLIADVSGMLSFYEATHLRVHGEDILEEALAFTTAHLESATTRVSNPLAAQITQALERPLRKSLERLGARRYMSIYQDEASHSECLLKLAKLDFNLVQPLHKKELQEITRWWRALDFERKLPFARDRMVELYFWIVGVYFEPKYSVGRKIMTKVSVLLTIMDDIYDAFGTFEELVVFTEAIDRWDLNCSNELPNYMKIFYHALLNLFNEIEVEMVKEGRSYRVPYAIQAMKDQARSYFDEARWLHEGRIPSMEEYMSVATVSICYTFLTTIALLGMGDIVTKESFEWLLNDPKIVRAANTILRLMDDIVSTNFEKERGHAASSVDCYMKQYGVSEQETVDVFKKQIMDLWKDINKEFLRPTAVPMPVLKRVLNLTRVADLLYKGKMASHVLGRSLKIVLLQSVLIQCRWSNRLNTSFVLAQYIYGADERSSSILFREVRWLHEGRIPSMEEYMSVATVSISYTFLTTISLLGLGDIVTKESFEWLLNDPKIVRAANTIFRLMDDIVSTNFERKRGHAASSADCYMKQYGVSEQETVDVFKKQIMVLWKDINEEFLRPTAVPMPVLKRVLNLTRVVDLLDKEEDGFTHVGRSQERVLLQCVSILCRYTLDKMRLDFIH